MIFRDALCLKPPAAHIDFKEVQQVLRYEAEVHVGPQRLVAGERLEDGRCSWAPGEEEDFDGPQTARDEARKALLVHQHLFKPLKERLRSHVDARSDRA